MKVYKENSFTRYEHLPMHHRLMYWVDYLNRLVHYSLSDKDLSSEKHDQILTEIARVTATIKILQNEPNNRVVESKATAKSSQKRLLVPATSSPRYTNVRTRGK
jgi:hypothetical protein